MTTIPSIDAMTTLSDAVAVDVTPSPAAPVAFDSSAIARPVLAEECRPFGGLAELVADNAVLGETLQSLVDALDMPRRIDADAKPVAVDATLVVAANMKPAVVATVKAEAEAIPRVAEKPVVCGEPGALALPQPTEASGSGFKPPCVTDASVVEDKPLEDKTVVLQAMPVVTAPSGDSVVSVCEAIAGTVSAVSRIAPIDVSTMFLAAAEEVAAAVTVSPALMRGEAGEIRVQLRPDVLEGTEVVVAVDGKKMDVTFVPAVTHVADTVAANQTLVQQQLAAKIPGFEISVAVAQTVATNVSVGVASSVSAQAAVARARRTNGRA